MAHNRSVVYTLGRKVIDSNKKTLTAIETICIAVLVYYKKDNELRNSFISDTVEKDFTLSDIRFNL